MIGANRRDPTTAEKAVIGIQLTRLQALLLPKHRLKPGNRGSRHREERLVSKDHDVTLTLGPGSGAAVFFKQG